MSRGYPSMTALLGLLAIAGYQNRDKLAEMLSGLGKGGSAAGSQGGIGGILSQITGSTGGASAGGFLSGGSASSSIGSGRTAKVQTADSWVGSGPNQQIAPPQLEQAIGPDVLNTLSKQTGLSREELLARLSRELPDAVDKYTPQGRLPTG